jgi:LPS-assembly protein
VLAVGATSVIPQWSLDGSLRWSAQDRALIRSVITAQHDAGQARRVSVSHYYTRGQSDQWAFGWQWPLRWSLGKAGPAAPGLSASCQRQWYSLGRMNYSVNDRRVTNALVGFEVDAGCWSSRLFIDVQATGSGQSTARLMFQLELTGLSSSPGGLLRVLKDNPTGFRPMREDSVTTPSGTLP